MTSGAAADPLYLFEPVVLPETRGTEASHNSIIPSEEWQQAQDHEGNFYWYNTRTNQSQYEDPYDGSRPDTAGY